MIRRSLCGWLWLSIALWSSAASAAVKAYADRSQMSSDQTVVFVLEHDGQPSSQPDLTPLREDFEVMSSSRSSSMSFTNGEMMARVQLRLTLSPKRTGQLTLPSIAWGNERSAPVPLTVTGIPDTDGDGAADSPVFLETTLDSVPSYVQAAVNVTVRVYSSQPLYQGALEFPTKSDALVQQLGADTMGTATRNGRTYRVIERRYVLFPQRSGKLELPGAVLNAQIVVRDRQDPFADDPFSDLFGPGGRSVTRAKPIRVNGEAIHFNVAPRPASVSASYWLPAQNVSITAEWQPPSDQPRARVGEPLTLDVRLQADGLMAAQLPDIAALLPLPTGLKAYPDQAKLDNQTRGTRVVGTRSQRIALIADQPGEITLPEFRVQWWDIAADQAREAIVPAQRLTILPVAPGSSAAALAPPAAQLGSRSSAASSSDGSANVPLQPGNASNVDSRWLWVSLTFAALWIATLAAWWCSRRSADRRSVSTANIADERSGTSASQARRAFHEACRRNDPQAARTRLLAWAATAWPAHPPTGLRALARQLQREEVEALLLALDRACYAGEPWEGTALGAALAELRKRERQQRNEVLQPLYP